LRKKNLKKKKKKKNNLISTHSILKNGGTIMMKGVNTKDRLQIYKNKKSHCKYRGKMKKTCSRLIQFLQIIIVTKNFIYNIDTNLWHSR